MQTRTLPVLLFGEFPAVKSLFLPFELFFFFPPAFYLLVFHEKLVESAGLLLVGIRFLQLILALNGEDVSQLRHFP